MLVCADDIGWHLWYINYNSPRKPGWRSSVVAGLSQWCLIIISPLWIKIDKLWEMQRWSPGGLHLSRCLNVFDAVNRLDVSVNGQCPVLASFLPTYHRKSTVQFIGSYIQLLLRTLVFTYPNPRHVLISESGDYDSPQKNITALWHKQEEDSHMIYCLSRGRAREKRRVKSRKDKLRPITKKNINIKHLRNLILVASRIS